MIRCEGLSVRSAALPSGIDRLFYIIRFFFAPAVPSEAAWPNRTAENRGRRRPPKTKICSYNVPISDVKLFWLPPLSERSIRRSTSVLSTKWW